MDNDQLTVNWMNGPLAPDAVFEFMACKCSKKCALPGCECLVNGLKCSPACKLQTCDNMYQEEDVLANESSDSEYEDDDDIDT